MYLMRDWCGAVCVCVCVCAALQVVSGGLMKGPVVFCVGLICREQMDWSLSLSGLNLVPHCCCRPI